MNVHDLFQLRGKVAIVTGGGSGIGRQMAEGLAEAGADLILCARKVERCEQAAADLSERHGVRALAMACDVRIRDDVQAVVDWAVGELGGVDVLVNNAGVAWGAPAEDYPLEGWQKTLDVNLTGVFLMSQSVGRAMIASGRGGKIVNIASVLAFVAEPPELQDALAYSASKAAVVGFTRDLGVKWARHRINVNAIAPGWFPSDMSSAVLERDPERFTAAIPLGRFGGADDLKGAVVFFASAASDFVTGQTLLVDGGRSAR